MTEQTSHQFGFQSPHALTGVRWTTGLAIVFERLWPKLLPLLIVCLLFASASWFGVFRSFGESGRLVAAALFAMLGLAALYPLLRVRMPTSSDITARIERANRLEHQPIAAQTDRPSGAFDPMTDALWQEHQRRMAEKLKAVGADRPRPSVPRLDPFALRSMPLLIAAIALAFSYGSYGGRLADIFYGAPPPEPVPPRVDAWVTPPAYTGKAPIFLTSAAMAGTSNFAVPANSEVVLRVTGGTGAEIAKLGNKALKPQEPAVPSIEGEFKPLIYKEKLTADVHLTLKTADKSLNDWTFKIIADTPPKIDFTADPERAPDGKLALSYKAADDYGVASAQALIALDRPDPKARPLFTLPELKLSAPRRNSKDGLARTAQDLTQHPFAGAPVRIVLSATDDAKQEGRSTPRATVVPERYFSSPLARALVEQRRLLALDANKRPRVLNLLDAISMRPDDTIKNPAHFLGLYTARLRLAHARSDDDLRDVVAYLWEIANGIENSGLSDAQKRMKQAQEKLAQALANGASDKELEKLMQELRDAMKGVMKELAEQARKNPGMAQNMQPNSQELRQSDIDQMMNKIEELAKQGNKQQAQELLSQLNEMMNNLQAGQGQHGGEGDSAMGEQLNKLGEMMRRQQQLMDQTQKLDRQGQGQSGENGDPQQGQGLNPGQGEGALPGEGGQSFGGLQGQQGELRGDLQGLIDGLKGLGLDPGKDFGDAGKSMGRAENKLGEGEGGEALADQSDALDALRKGGQGLMNQMREALGKQGGGMQKGQRQTSDTGKDPLGRPRATTGPDFGQATKVPDEIDVQRAREILDAIRKRLGGALSPNIERNYLERLLKFD